MIQAVGYTDDGAVFTRMVLNIEDRPMSVTMHMTQENARKFAGDLQHAADRAQGADKDERDSQDADKSGTA